MTHSSVRRDGIESLWTVRVGLALALCLAAGCSTTESNQVVADGGVDSSTDGGIAAEASTRDAGADVDYSCQLVDGGCVGAGGCCTYLGYSLNEDGGCLERTPTVLGCFVRGNDGSCACSLTESCLVPNTEAGTAPVYWRRDACVYDSAKFRECEVESEKRAYAASIRPACP